MNPTLFLGEMAVNVFPQLPAYLGVWQVLKWGQYQWDGTLDGSNMDVLMAQMMYKFYIYFYPSFT